MEIYGKISQYLVRGRPSAKKVPQPDWQYLRAVKERCKGRLPGTRLPVIYGDTTNILAQEGKGTSYVERFKLTLALLNSRLIHKRPAYSQIREMHETTAAWEDTVYNVAWPLETVCLEIPTDILQSAHRLVLLLLRLPAY